jgi:predicted lipoprotein with Yx(FWY)xxD motif
MHTRLASALAISLVAFATLANAAPPVKTADGILVNSAGMTLYTFDKDAGGKSMCNGPCATLWPPAAADADAKPEGDMTLITRDDGAKQWAYKGKPVYLYASDKKAGDKTGDNFKDVWHVIKP